MNAVEPAVGRAYTSTSKPWLVARRGTRAFTTALTGTAITIASANSFVILAIIPDTNPCLNAQEVVTVTGSDRPLEAGFEEIFRVGTFEGESWELFNDVDKVAFDGRGNLYVFDRGPGLGSDLRMLVFDRSGRFVREFGRAGDGPGEFRRPRVYAVTQDGNTIVGDWRAYQVFDDTGEFVRRIRPPEGSEGHALLAMPIRSDPHGDALFAGAFGAEQYRRNPSGSPPDSRPVIRLGIAGEVAEADTLFDAWLAPRGEAASGFPR
jgi:hypothetical protein